MKDMTKNKTFKKLDNIVEGLAMHDDPESVALLEEIGTNSSLDCVREMASRALVRKNMSDALRIVIEKEGKGINDLAPIVATRTIGELFNLEDKSVVIEVLDEVIEGEHDEKIKETARCVRAMMAV